MYAWLRQRLPAPLADLAAALWYALLVEGIWVALDLPQAPFRYIGL